MSKAQSVKGAGGVPWVQIMENEFECLVVRRGDGGHFALKLTSKIFPHRGYHSNARKHFKINSSIKSLLNHSRNMCRKFQGSYSKTLVEDSFLRIKNSVLR